MLEDQTETIRKLKEVSHFQEYDRASDCTRSCSLFSFYLLIFEPSHKKTNNSGFQPGSTQTGLYSLRSRLEARNFRFKKKRNGTIHVAKIKMLISCAVTAQLICVFVFP